MSAPGARVQERPFGRAPGGQEIAACVLTAASGMEMRVLALGGIVQSLRVPDRRGRLADVTLGYDTAEGYAADGAYLGALIGRVGNRIARGRFSLDGRDHQLPVNDPPNSLHGGPAGFHTAVWGMEPFERGAERGVVLTHTSPDGDAGFPGTLRVRVTYTLTDDGEWIIDYHAATDAPTPVSLTQHAYFNLAGAGAGPVLEHEVQLPASRYVPVDETMIPTGELAPVAGTPFDFRAPRALGERIEEAHEQLRRAHGYDHTLVLDADSGGEPALAARVREPGSGRVLELLTTEPGVQLYSGNWLSGEPPGKGGHAYARRTGFCLETQHFPDSPNQPHFPSIVLRPGEEYGSRTVYRFGTDGG